MFKRLDKIFKAKLDEVVFIELKQDADAKIKDMQLDTKIPLPIMFNDVMNKVKGASASDISTGNLIKGMAFVTSVDEEFIHKDYYFKILLEIDDKIGLYLLKHAFDLANEGNKVNALIYFKASLNFLDEEIDVLCNYGRCCVEIAQSKKELEELFSSEAREVFEYLTDKYPEHPIAFYQLGFLYSNIDEYKLSETAWLQAIKNNIGENEKLEIVRNLHDLNAKLKFEEGYKLVLNERPTEGLEILLALEPEYLDWWNLMFFIGLGYRMTKEYDLALKYYAKVMELNTGHIMTYNEIGLCYMTMKRYDEAVKAFKEALKMDRENPEMLCNLGIVYIEKREYDEAEKFFMRSLKKDPKDEITASWIQRLNDLKMAEL